MRTAAVVGGVMIVAAAVVAAQRQRMQAAGAVAADYLGELADTVAVWLEGIEVDMKNQNLSAFLRMIRFAEGTAGPNGYRMLFGGELFDGFEDHPRRPITRLSNGRQIMSTAAGAYQILARTWDSVKGAAGVVDFSPSSQDRAAAELIKRRGALRAVYEGRFADAVKLCAREWASLPGAPYGQPVKTWDQVAAAYSSAGGVIA